MRKLAPLLLLLLLVACDSAAPTPIPSAVITPAATLPPTLAAPPTATAASVAPNAPLIVSSPTALAVSSTLPLSDTNLPDEQPTSPVQIDNPTLPAYNPPIALLVEGLPVLAADTTPSNKLIVSTAKGLYRRSGGDDTADPATWAWAKLSDKSPLPNLFAVDDDTFLAADTPSCATGGAPGQSLMLSTDTGKTWNAVSADDQPNAPLYARPVNTSGDDLFAIACTGVYRSTDNAASWQRQPDLTVPNATITDLALNSDASTMYFAATTEAGVATIYRSDANVNRWAAPLPLTSTWGMTFVRIGPPAESIYFGSSLGLYERQAGGSDWQLDTAGLKNTIIAGDPRTGYTPTAREQNLGLYDLAPTNDLLLLATADGIYAAAPGQPWQQVALTATPAYHIFFAPAGLYARTPNGVVLLRNK